MADNGQILCPQCKIPMEYTLETEKSSNGTRKLIRYYKCPACGTQVTDEVIIIESNGNASIILKIIDDRRTVLKKIMPTRRRGGRRR